MDIKLSQRIANLPPYLFVEISRKIAAKKEAGEEVFSFAIGDPDIPTPEHIIEKLCQAARDPENHHYPESASLPELRQAIAGWYHDRFGVSLDPDREVLPVIGAKEGIGHLSFCFLDPGDVALVPDPGYVPYYVGALLAGGEPVYMPLKEENDYLPDYGAIPAEVAARARMMWINYPNMPTGAVADIAFYNKTVDFARRNNIMVVHDAPYTEVAYEGYRPPSFLQADGAREVGIEFHSFSKTYNMPGWRIGMAVGNAEMIGALRTLKSNLDSGIPLAIQLAAIEALSGPQDCIAEHNSVYQRRRDLLVDTLNRIGLECRSPKASLYVWAKVPPNYTSAEFAADLLEKQNVVVTPGAGFGPHGEGYVRFSLTIADVAFVKAISKLSAWRDTRHLTRKFS